MKFCFKTGKTATETVEIVHAAYGHEALMRSNILLWYGRFCEGQEDVQDDPRSGCPCDSRNGQQHRKGSAAVATKSSPVTLNDSG